MMLAHGGDTCIPAPGGGGVSRDTWQLQIAGARGPWQFQIAGTRAVRAAAKLQISSGVRQGWAAAARGWWAAFLQPAQPRSREICCQVTTDQPSPAQPRLAAEPVPGNVYTAARATGCSTAQWLANLCAVLCCVCRVCPPVRPRPLAADQTLTSHSSPCGPSAGWRS